MKIKIMLALPTTDGPNPKGWRTAISEVVELEPLDTAEDIMKALVERINSLPKV